MAFGDKVKSLLKALISYEGEATAAGAADGSTLVCSALTAQPDFDGCLVVITSGDYAGQARDISGTTAGGTITPASAFGGQIADGTQFKVITIRTTPAEVAALAADIGDASASALGSLYAILGDPAQTFLAMVGYEGATSLAAKITAARAALLDEITALRMAELDAANMPADIDTLLTLLQNATYGLAALETLVDDLETRLTAARAGYLDELDFDLQGMLATIAGYIDAEITALLGDVGDASGSTLGSIYAILGNPAQTFLTMIGYQGATSLADKLTAARAALLDEITAVRLAELDAANLPADVDIIKALVDSAESAGPFSYLDAGGEQDVVEDTATTRRKINIEFSNRNMTQAGTFRVYRKTDGTNYDQWTSASAAVGAGDDRTWDAEFVTNQAWKLTYEEDLNEAAARAIPYNVITQVIE